METHIATRKTHRCDACGRMIPIGARYFAKDGGDWREHTNCLEYKKQVLLVSGYNQLRRLGKVKSVDREDIDEFGKLIE